MKLVIVWE